MTIQTKALRLTVSMLVAGTTATGALAGEAAGEFTAKPIGAGTYSGHQGKIGMSVSESEKKEIVTVVGDMPVGSAVGFHYHPGYALVAVTKGKLASLDSAECDTRVEYEAGEAFFDFPGHRHDIVNIGDEPAQFVVTFLLPEGEKPLYPIDDPGAENCH
ncbi:cupin domain-containing protein [Nitratireductor luteus]|uniref:cupin domain-containing protein n=1 Tax=Nitratireductor luteus TaxID=2976980 RepID=UPI00223F164F|nr:cupin domain-containing protein [Nitratireductor luteus]